MGKINDYSTEAVNSGDKFLGSDEDGVTKNFTPQALVDFINESEGSTAYYKVFLTQSSTNAPVPTVAASTLDGTVIYSYNDIGEYTGTLTGAFNSTSAIVIGSTDSWDTEVKAYFLDANSFKIETKDTGSLANGVLSNQYIEIYVYGA